MIFKEEEIMIPMTLDVFSLADWQQIAKDSHDIGFSFSFNIKAVFRATRFLDRD